MNIVASAFSPLLQRNLQRTLLGTNVRSQNVLYSDFKTRLKFSRERPRRIFEGPESAQEAKEGTQKKTFLDPPKTRLKSHKNAPDGSDPDRRATGARSARQLSDPGAAAGR